MLRAERQARFGSIIAHPWRGFGSGRANRYHPSGDLVLGRDDGFASATPFEDFDDLDIDLPTVDIRFQQRASARTEHSEQACHHQHATIAILSVERIMACIGKPKDSKRFQGLEILFWIDAKDRHGSTGVLGTTRRQRVALP
ncbi:MULTISPECIES: hypothetical protein [unclassified Bradyrhizobium]|uniref:hypothetical protein n=1 Tax=unclassified Bradyrhizobium TaxID=2631580 RepID=UPI001CD38471|nr:MULTISPECIES: hypothetical protein [unclassified Bradyrhizobium]MCA1438356.1 hypothetical protein [Bradyrhizobium sp. BRP20]MCA1473120.1 hypothetical protein [Bradyrhizobium sp. IC3195]MCA1501927.1 hypothetical protein [Bradyrhizobium sp. NBAIM14]MCA1552340.1 hypothetical protein [Bradyrhizobium sp. BRP19]